MFDLPVECMWNRMLKTTKIAYDLQFNRKNYKSHKYEAAKCQNGLQRLMPHSYLKWHFHVLWICMFSAFRKSIFSFSLSMECCTITRSQRVFNSSALFRFFFLFLHWQSSELRRSIFYCQNPHVPLVMGPLLLCFWLFATESQANVFFVGRCTHSNRNRFFNTFTWCLDRAGIALF